MVFQVTGIRTSRELIVFTHSYGLLYHRHTGNPPAQTAVHKGSIIRNRAEYYIQHLGFDTPICGHHLPPQLHAVKYLEQIFFLFP